MTSDFDKAALAHHESGHAVAALSLGNPAALVTIVPAAGRAGCVWAEMPTPEMLASPIAMDIAGTVDRCRRIHALLQMGKSREAGAAAIVQMINNGIIVLAGPAAEAKFAGAYDSNLARCDLIKAEIFATTVAISPEASWQHYRTFQVEAQALIEKNWAAVSAVAERLIEKKELSGDEVDAILAEAGDRTARVA